MLSMSTNTNSKYWSMDHSDSTAPSAYDTKKLSAAGVRISYENASLGAPRGGWHDGAGHGLGCVAWNVVQYP